MMREIKKKYRIEKKKERKKVSLSLPREKKFYPLPFSPPLSSSFFSHETKNKGKKEREKKSLTNGKEKV